MVVVSVATRIFNSVEVTDTVAVLGRPTSFVSTGAVTADAEYVCGIDFVTVGMSITAAARVL